MIIVKIIIIIIVLIVSQYFNKISYQYIIEVLLLLGSYLQNLFIGCSFICKILL